MEKQGKDKGEIALMIEEQRTIIPEEVSEPEYADNGYSAPYNEFSFSEPTESADELGLTEEDVTYLKLK